MIDGYMEDKYDEGKKFKVVEMDSSSLTIDGELELDHEFLSGSGKKSITWCLGKDDVSAQDIFRL